jgi:hypothetical protein
MRIYYAHSNQRWPVVRDVAFFLLKFRAGSLYFVDG